MTKFYSRHNLRSYGMPDRVYYCEEPGKSHDTASPTVFSLEDDLVPRKHMIDLGKVVRELTVRVKMFPNIEQAMRREAAVVLIDQIVPQSNGNISTKDFEIGWFPTKRNRFDVQGIASLQCAIERMYVGDPDKDTDLKARYRDTSERIIKGELDNYLWGETISFSSIARILLSGFPNSYTQRAHPARIEMASRVLARGDIHRIYVNATEETVGHYVVSAKYLQRHGTPLKEALRVGAG